MLNIVVPMAGRGSRFSSEGYKEPKPLIKIHGFEMIRYVISNLTPSIEHRFIFLVLEEHINKYRLVELLSKWATNCIIIPVKTVTMGAACTVLLAKEYVNNNDPLMIANSDQWVDFDINNYIYEFEKSRYDGSILTMYANDPKWSFIRKNGKFITQVVEKEVVSNEATVGIYNFKHGCEFVRSSEKMIAEDIRVNNEFYVAPVYNQMINDGKKIVSVIVGSEDNGMYGIGTPSDLDKFRLNEISIKASNQIRKTIA